MAKAEDPAEFEEDLQPRGADIEDAVVVVVCADALAGLRLELSRDQAREARVEFGVDKAQEAPEAFNVGVGGGVGECLFPLGDDADDVAGGQAFRRFALPRGFDASRGACVDVRGWPVLAPCAGKVAEVARASSFFDAVMRCILSW